MVTMQATTRLVRPEGGRTAARACSILCAMGGDGPGDRIVVPFVPGPLLRPDAPRRDRDDLDDVIDELFPDSDEPPGWFDAALLATGGMFTGWALSGDRTGVLVIGLGCLAIGTVLPARWLWRRARRTRRAAGATLPGADATVARLVRAYDELGELVTGDADAARTAAHGAALEVATLLDGRPPSSEAERDYVAARAAAIEGLVDALRTGPAPVEAGRLDPTLVARAREELDALTDGGPLARLTELTAQARDRHDRT
jgi:hypothetical protein